MQLINSLQNGSEAGDDVTVAVDNATAGCASDSQAGNHNKVLPIKECVSGKVCFWYQRKLQHKSDGENLSRYVD